MMCMFVYGDGSANPRGRTPCLPAETSSEWRPWRREKALFLLWEVEAKPLGTAFRRAYIIDDEELI